MLLKTKENVVDIYIRKTVYCLMIIFVFSMHGCIQANQYGDPQSLNKVPLQAKLLLDCTIGWGASGGFEMSDGKHDGDIILVSGDTPIDTERVLSRDYIHILIIHPCVGPCIIQININGHEVKNVTSYDKYYRVYFYPKEAGL